jgi:hypothetical protein
MTIRRISDCPTYGWSVVDLPNRRFYGQFSNREDAEAAAERIEGAEAMNAPWLPKLKLLANSSGWLALDDWSWRSGAT